MKVFISWSGSTSHKIAVVLREWIPSVIQSVEPYVSSEDIDKGARWSTDIAEELQGSKYGILCITPDNLNAPWLNFEAGALSKTIIDNFVSPFLLGLKPSDVKGPIVQFQATTYNEEDIKKLVHGINEANSENKIEKDRLNSYFEVWWPKLKPQLDEIEKEITSSKKEPAKKVKEENNSDGRTEELLEEILSLVRTQQRFLKNPEEILPKDYLQFVLDSARKPKRDNEVSRGALRDLEDGVREIEKIVRFNPDMDQPELFQKIDHALELLRRSSEHIIRKLDRGRW